MTPLDVALMAGALVLVVVALAVGHWIDPDDLEDEEMP